MIAPRDSYRLVLRVVNEGRHTAFEIRACRKIKSLFMIVGIEIPDQIEWFFANLGPDYPASLRVGIEVPTVPSVVHRNRNLPR